ncbi:hypothetical protein DL96DRAFT_848582 [Flagelloscypha sp. PMI_526]|nr:hypothetical protein DL96DRAFT_848582 [Flagelloscypha sp. PMI_526]
MFTLLSQFESVKSSSGKSYNYEEKYPEDTPGQELGEDARVFKVYNELAEEYDRDMIRGFRDTLDSLLIFASLFSAVITTFVVQTSQALSTDQGVITNHLLADIAALLRDNGNATVLTTIPPSNFGPDTSMYKTTDIWINGLFFASLSLSLATALLSVLAKQWLQAYTAVISGPAKEIALIRHLRFRGLEKWKMHEIIGALPLILHASLALFFAGLFIFVRTLYEGIAYVVAIIGGLAFLCYLCSIILPAIDLQCPYRVTLLYRPSKYVVYTAQSFYPILRRMGLSVAKTVAPTYVSRQRLSDDRWPVEPGSLQMEEADAVSGDMFTSDCLLWLRDLSSNITIRRIVAWTAAAKQDDHFLLEQLNTKHPNSIKRLFDLPTTELLCQSAYDADDTVDVGYIPSTDRHDRPKFTFSSPIDGKDNTTKLPIRALRGLAENGNQMDPERWNSVLDEYIRSTVQTNRYAMLGTLLSLASDHLDNARGAALAVASEHGHINVVRLLLDKGVDPNLVVSIGTSGSALSAAAYWGRLDVIELLVEKGADINLVLSAGSYGSALAAAAYRGQLEVVKWLVEKGADVNLGLSSGSYGSALAAAAWGGTLSVVEWLVEKGADVNSLLLTGKSGSALAAARSSGFPDVTEFLVAKHALEIVT